MLQKTIDVKFQKNDVNEDGTFSGYGSVFDVVDNDYDVVSSGAFTKSLSRWKEKGALPALLWQHRTDKPVGIYTAMSEDKNGLYVEGKIFKDMNLGKDVYELLKGGAVTGLSIGFNTVEAEWDRAADARRLNEVDLWEVSLVTFPCNEAAKIHSVKAADKIDSIREFEGLLRKSGYSQNDAKMIASKGFKEFLSCREGMGTAPENRRDGDDMEQLKSSIDMLLKSIKH